MLGTIEILYKSSDHRLYDRICECLEIHNDSPETSEKIVWINSDISCPIKKVNCYSIHYHNNSGRIWWTTIMIDLRLLYHTKDYYPVSAEQLHDINSRIDHLFQDFFHFDFKSYLPDLISSDLFDKRISYLEYMVYINDIEADALIKRLDRAYFDEKQLDPEYYERFWIRNATPAFTINKINDNTLRLCVKCRETALKAMYKKVLDSSSGIPNHILLQKENVTDTFCKQIRKYTKPMVFKELSREVIEKNL